MAIVLGIIAALLMLGSLFTAGSERVSGDVTGALFMFGLVFAIVGAIVANRNRPKREG